MSQLKVNSIVDAAGGSSAVLYGVASPPNSMGFRNRIINGEMRIDQRNAGGSVTVNTASAFYAADRFRLSGVASSGVFTGQQVTDAPSGFSNSLKATVTTTDASLAGSDIYYAVQNIEGFNTADLAWGTAGASTVTLSFWAKSSVTGIFGGALSNNAVNRSYPFTYAISAANTWEFKTVTVTGDTTGTWETGNNTGIRVYFGLGIASGFSGTAGAWAGSQLLSATGAVNLMATNLATWQITGVQLEAGTVATPFERRDYGRELMMCQRYYMKLPNDAVSSTDAANTNKRYFPVVMRASPTMTGIVTSGSGASIIAFENYGWMQSGVNSVTSTITGITASAEL